MSIAAEDRKMARGGTDVELTWCSGDGEDGGCRMLPETESAVTTPSFSGLLHELGELQRSVALWGAARKGHHCKDLRKMLRRFLTLDAPHHHDASLWAFVEIWDDVFVAAESLDCANWAGGRASSVSRRELPGRAPVPTMPARHCRRRGGCRRTEIAFAACDMNPPGSAQQGYQTEPPGPTQEKAVEEGSPFPEI